MSTLPTTVTSDRGFTLVETLVAIALLMIAIVAPMYAVQQATIASYAARDQLIAASLAQEGMEYIRFNRDSSYLSTGSAGGTWNSGVCGAPDGCEIDPRFDTVRSCGSSGCPYLELTRDNVYSQNAGGSSGSVTRFKRKVVVRAVAPEYSQVTVTMEWESGKRAYALTLTENLYAWQ